MGTIRLNMEKRLIIAITLSVLVILLFQKFIAPPGQAPQNIGQPHVSAKDKGIKGETDIPQQVSYQKEKEAETTVETDNLILTFTNIGGSLKSIKSKEYDSVLANNLEPPLSIFSLISPEISPDIAFEAYKLTREKNRIIYTYTGKKNISVRKEFILHKDRDYIELQLFIDNFSGSDFSADYTIVGPSRIEPVTSMKGRDFIELNADIDGKLMKKSSVKNEGENIKGIISWVGLKNRYFAIVLKPPGASDSIFIRRVKNQLTTGVTVQPRVILPNSSIQDSYVMYIGPLVKSRLVALDIGIDNIISYGFFGGISVFLLNVLSGINSIVHNWGVSIIIVTFLINIILFPLTRKSFHSMQKMQEIQPHMEKLRKVHKDNPQRLNKEIAELYRTYNVNPFGGCLPMLLQLPIFLAFYQALMRSIELKNAAFLWIKDLSSPDALFVFSKPVPILGEQFNLLPIITLIVMFVQQKISTASSAKNMSPEMAKQQRIMALFFPIFFGFILYTFPSGLVLYWLTNSLLMIAEQLSMRRHE